MRLVIVVEDDGEAVVPAADERFVAGAFGLAAGGRGIGVWGVVAAPADKMWLVKFKWRMGGQNGTAHHSEPYSVPEYLYPRSRQLRAHC